MLRIRPFVAGQNADYEARSALVNAVWPDTHALSWRGRHVFRRR